MEPEYSIGFYILEAKRAKRRILECERAIAHLQQDGYNTKIIKRLTAEKQAAECDLHLNQSYIRAYKILPTKINQIEKYAYKKYARAIQHKILPNIQKQRTK